MKSKGFSSYGINILFFNFFLLEIYLTQNLSFICLLLS